jgi:hypothetical protein
MPDSVPGSSFDQSGVCVWCRTRFPNYVLAGEDALQEVLASCRAKQGPADCLVGVSGGKDSSYVLLQLQRKFSMRVEAFTYVHDGSTDFALENARRTCGVLGVKHHVVSLPNHLHRETCKKFFRAWVVSEDPVAAAMTCVACKHLHIQGTRLARDRGIPLVVWARCPLETPPFIPTQPKQPEGSDNAVSEGMVVLAMRLLKSTFTSWNFCSAFLRHCPTCVAGCLAFNPGNRFLKLRYPSVKHLQFFEYCEWCGAGILQTLAQEVGWRVPQAVKAEWHSDCLFNVLKEYMFQKMFRVSYMDAFLSNQIRRGLITREQAYQDLVVGKRYFAGELRKTLQILGLDDLCGKVDPACFAVDEAFGSIMS